MIGLVCIIAAAIVGGAALIFAGYMIGVLAALEGVDKRDHDVRREMDCADAWQREAERQRAEARRWKGRALRYGWRWDGIDAWRAARGR